METKTALFCVIPDSDKSYNFIIGMLYTQIFRSCIIRRTLTVEEDSRFMSHLCLMSSQMSHCRMTTVRAFHHASREISSIIIIQNFAQLKALFKDTWETIPGNCDTFIYLGGNEQSTHKYVGAFKKARLTRSQAETKGRQGAHQGTTMSLVVRYLHRMK